MRLRRLLALTAVAAGVSGCGGSGDDPGGERRRGSVSAEDAGSTVSSGAGSRISPEALDTPGGSLPGEGPPRVHPLLIVNPLDVTAFVFAAAGAGNVALDTIRPRDSVRVDIRVRADIVRIEARDSRGVVLDRREAALEGDRLNRWEILPDPPGSVTPAPPDSLFLQRTLYSGRHVQGHVRRSQGHDVSERASRGGGK